MPGVRDAARGKVGPPSLICTGLAACIWNLLEAGADLRREAGPWEADASTSAAMGVPGLAPAGIHPAAATVAVNIIA